MLAVKKTMDIELAADNPSFNDNYYADLSLPAENYEIRDAVQRIRSIGGNTDITILGCDYLPELDDVRLDSPTLDELNFFAKQLAALGEDEVTALQAVAPMFICDDIEPVSMKDLINLTYGLDSVPVISGIYTDEQLGEFVINNDLNDDVAAIPKNSLYLLDKAQIGGLQRENDSGVFIGNTYVVAGEYMLPEIYDGINLPDEIDEPDYVFDLKIAGTPSAVSDETDSSGVWLTLPIDRKEADNIARRLGETRIEDCVCYGFKSAVPQITSDMSGGMKDFDQLNSLALHYTLLSPTDQVKFKAVLSAEKPKDIASSADIADNLRKYELTAAPGNSDQFFKQYLMHHLDSRFDFEWLDTLLTGNEGNRLLERLGASVTDYGIISARGHSLYELVPYNEPEIKALKTQTITDEKLEVIEIIDRIALFSDSRIADDEVPAGLYKYDLRQNDDGDGFATIEPYVKVNHGGTVFLKEELEFGDAGYIALDEDTSPNFSGELMTPEEFASMDEYEEQTGGMTFE